MTGGLMASWVIAGIPLAGATVGLALLRHPALVRTWATAVSLASLGSVAGLSGSLSVPPEGHLLLYLVPLAASAALLGQPVHASHRQGWIMTLILLGLGLGSLTNGTIAGKVALLALLGLVIHLLFCHHTPLWPLSRRGIGVYGLAAAAIVTAAVASPPFSAAASLAACAILLPLAPFHDGYLAALTRLPGSLPPLLVVLLPAIGLHELGTLIPTVPDPVALAITILAAAGALYGSIKALAQSRVRLLLSYGSLSFFSILWWSTATMRAVTPGASLFAGAVGLATGGLLLAWQVIRTRYGDDVDPQSISGLASTMPRYAVLLSLLALAAMGLPPFGVFAGLMVMLLAPSHPLSAALPVMLLAWLAASWYIMHAVQGVLFGRHRPDLRYEDLLPSEFASLLLILLMVIALGFTPPDVFGPGPTSPPVAGTGAFAWHR